MRRSSEGLTLVELVVAASLLIVMLGIVGVYFARQAALTRDTQARNQVQDAARGVMQLVTNDLLLAGANQYVVTSSGVTTTTKVSIASPLTGTDGNLADGVEVRYASSLQQSLTDACRHVIYAMSGGVLQRSDVTCGQTKNLSDLAQHVLAFDLAYVCSDAPTDIVSDPASCVAAGAYVRSVEVGLMLRSDNPARAAGPTASYTSLTNSTLTATCPSSYVCAVLTQDVETPSLKDK